MEEVADANGELSKNDFILHVKNSNMFSQFDSVDPESDHHWNEKVKKAWKIFDKNGDGKLTPQEFRWMTRQSLLSERQIDLVFQRFDSDGDGNLNFKEFKTLIMRNRTRKEAARIIAEEEEAKKPKIIPHWKKSYLENLQKMQQLEENPPAENPTAADESFNEVLTDEDIEEEIDKFEGNPRKILKRDSSVYSDIPEDVVQDNQIDQEIEEEIEDREGNDMTTVKLHINCEK